MGFLNFLKRRNATQSDQQFLGEWKLTEGEGPDQRLNAESYVANGNCFTFVTRDGQLHHDVTTLMHSF